MRDYKSCCKFKWNERENKETKIQERIENIYIIKETEKDIYPNDEQIYEFSYEVALIVQTEKSLYVLWRHLIFDRIYVAVCSNIKDAIESINELNEDDEEVEDVTIIKEKIIEQL